MGTMLTNIIAVGSAGFISSKIFKCLGKNEFGELMMLCGWIGMGISFFTWLNGASFSVSKNWGADIFKGFSSLIKWIITNPS